MTEGFSSLGLAMNAAKTEFMMTRSLAHHCQISGVAYARRWGRNESSYWERECTQVQCLNCGTLVLRQSLARHQQSLKCKTDRAAYVPPTPVRDRVARETVVPTPHEVPAHFKVSIPCGTRIDTPCPVPNCEYRVVANRPSKRSAMCDHFAKRHMDHSITLSKEGLLPQCNSCGIFATGIESDRHQSSLACYTLSEKRQRYFAKFEREQAANTTFRVNGMEL